MTRTPAQNLIGDFSSRDHFLWNWAHRCSSGSVHRQYRESIWLIHWLLPHPLHPLFFVEYQLPTFIHHFGTVWQNERRRRQCIFGRSNPMSGGINECLKRVGRAAQNLEQSWKMISRAPALAMKGGGK